MNSLLTIIFEHIYAERILPGQLEQWLQPRYKELASAVRELSAIYTRQRHRIAERLLADPLLRRAYLAYFLPCNLVKFKLILQELYARPAAQSHFPRQMRLLDLGCGPGTHLLGMLDFLAENPTLADGLECVGVDATGQNLQEARQLFDRLARSIQADHGSLRASLKALNGDIRHGLKLDHVSPFDLIVIGNVLNELFPDEPDRVERQYELVAGIVNRHLKPHGFLILIEPALKETSRDLLRLRDLLLKRLGLHVYAPCTHGHPCPAVASGNSSDWCHEDRVWQAPAHIQEIDALAGISKSSLKFSYAVISRHPISICETALNGGPLDSSPSQDPAKPQIWRVVSERLEEKGKCSVFLCGQLGRIRLTRQNKHGSGTNAPFGQLERGQIVMTDGLVAKKHDDCRAVQASTVQIMIR
jgi:ribosomal protein RSM22 (predicted rRNA methylase)